MNLSVGIIESDLNFREKLENFLNKRNIEVTLSVESFQELVIKATHEQQFDVLLAHLDEKSVPHFFKYKRLFPKAHLLAHATQSECNWVEAAISAGADAYVMKNGSFKNLKRAMESLAVGQAWIAPEATRMLLQKIREQESEELREGKEGMEAVLENLYKKHQLKKREVQVLKELLNAKRYSQIAEDIGISINTVRYYVKMLYRKFEVNSRSALQRMIYQKAQSGIHL